jgi:2-iminobutanoate/2-iminopropanoate deaminase
MRDFFYIVLIVGAALVVFVALNKASGSSEPPRRLSLPGKHEAPFSHAVVVGDTIYISGTLGVDEATGKPPAEAAEEAHLMLQGLKRQLELADSSMNDLVSVQVFCTDLALYAAFNAAYRTYFNQGLPTRTFVGTDSLLFGSRFEINAIAVKR